MLAEELRRLLVERAVPVGVAHAGCSFPAGPGYPEDGQQPAVRDRVEVDGQFGADLDLGRVDADDVADQPDAGSVGQVDDHRHQGDVGQPGIPVDHREGVHGGLAGQLGPSDRGRLAPPADGVGGSRNVPQSAHRGATSRRSLAACQNGSVPGSVEILTAPAGSAVASLPAALTGPAPGSARLSARGRTAGDERKLRPGDLVDGGAAELLDALHDVGGADTYASDSWPPCVFTGTVPGLRSAAT